MASRTVLPSTALCPRCHFSIVSACSTSTQSKQQEMFKLPQAQATGVHTGSPYYALTNPRSGAPIRSALTHTKHPMPSAYHHCRQNRATRPSALTLTLRATTSKPPPSGSTRPQHSVPGRHGYETPSSLCSAATGCGSHKVQSHAFTVTSAAACSAKTTKDLTRSQTQSRTACGTAHTQILSVLDRTLKAMPTTLHWQPTHAAYHPDPERALPVC